MKRSKFIENQIEEFKRQTQYFGNIMFIPQDGYCFNCKRDIVKKEIEKGNDGTTLVTRCPYCNKSYVD